MYLTCVLYIFMHFLEMRALQSCLLGIAKQGLAEKRIKSAIETKCIKIKSIMQILLKS